MSLFYLVPVKKISNQVINPLQEYGDMIVISYKFRSVQKRPLRTKTQESLGAKTISYKDHLVQKPFCTKETNAYKNTRIFGSSIFLKIQIVTGMNRNITM